MFESLVKIGLVLGLMMSSLNAFIYVTEIENGEQHCSIPYNLKRMENRYENKRGCQFVQYDITEDDVYAYQCPNGRIYIVTESMATCMKYQYLSR